jgi:2-keto-4-pentenoate hydratase/2-oxohepta-3-ene-1,7-dioic acid hydratase in catechol pathway
VEEKKTNMKLIRYGALNAEKPAVQLTDGRRIDVSAFTSDFDERFFASGTLAELPSWVATHADQCPVIDPSVRLGSCVARPSKIVCIGLNYAKHAAESGMALPTEPVVFFKATTAMCGPNDDLVIPRNSQKTDWEVELAFVIGKKASYVEEADAMNYVAAYLLHNDYSEREFQLERSGQWVKGKSADTFAPFGPYLVTPDEIADPHQLRLWLSVNGNMLQDSNTDDMVFKIPFLIHYLSQFMTLLPGDVISTGTPFGVGLGFKPPRYLKPGDVVELGVEGLGVQRQVARAWQAV